MFKRIITYQCPFCGYISDKDYDVCPACNNGQTEARGELTMKEDNDLFAITYTLQTTCLNHSSALIKALSEEEKIKSQIRKETISIIGDIIRAIK